MILFLAPKLPTEYLYRRIKDLPENKPAKGEGHFLYEYVVDFDISELRGPGRRYLIEELHWRKGAFINASTASLNINLTQYMVISGTLERVETISSLHLFCVRYDRCRVYIVSEERLDRVITGMGNEELFILNTEDSFIYLLLRRQTNDHGVMTYKLISACPRVQILIRTQRSANQVTRMRALHLRDLQCSIYDVIENCRGILDNEFRNLLLERRDTGILAVIAAIRGLVPVLKQLYQRRSQQDMRLHRPKNVKKAENRRLLHSIGKAFIQCLDQKYSPQLKGKYVTISVSTCWEICHVYLFKGVEKHLLDDQHKIWKYRIKDSVYAWESPYISLSDYDNLLDSSAERRLEIRFLISSVVRFLTRIPFGAF